MNRITDVVKNLIIVNVIIYLGVALTMDFSGINIVQYFQLYSPISERFIPIQLLSHMFMHGGLSHLFFNMLTLFFLGPFVESKMGSRRFLIFYLVCGFGAMIAHLGIDYIEYLNIVSDLSKSEIQNIFDSGKLPASFSAQEIEKFREIYNTPVVGASGAIYGVIAAFALFFPNTKLMLLIPPIPIKAKYLALIIIAIDLFSGISGQKTGIAHFAHLGGALTGLILVFIWYRNIFKR